MLEEFGASSTAEAVYLELLRDPRLTLDKLAAATGRTGGEVDTALAELRDLALLRASRESPTTIRPVPPGVGLESLLAREQDDLVERQRRLDRARVALSALSAEFTQAGPHGRRAMIEELVGVDEVRTRLEVLSARIRTEVLSLIPDGAQAADTLDASRPLDARLLERGVRMRTVYLDHVRDDPPTVEYAAWLREHGGRVRTAPSLPLRMIVIDRSTAMVPLDPQDSSAGAAVLYGAGAVAALRALFDLVWDGAQDLGVSNQADVSRLSGPERDLLRMLSEGETDEFIARRMGVSTRTIGRMISELMRRLETRSRFQLGVRAAAFGWASSAAR